MVPDYERATLLPLGTTVIADNGFVYVYSLQNTARYQCVCLFINDILVAHMHHISTETDASDAGPFAVKKGDVVKILISGLYPYDNNGKTSGLIKPFFAPVRRPF